MKVESFTPYSSDILPQGFKYPSEYLALSKDTSSLSTIPNFRWWFISSENVRYSPMSRPNNHKIKIELG